MAFTVKADFLLDPQVLSDILRGYFDAQEMVFNSGVVRRDDTLKGRPGETLTIPFYGIMGVAEEPLEGVAVVIQNISDSSFTATIKEVAIGFGVTDSALNIGLPGPRGPIDEGLKQMAKRLAEKVEDDIFAESYLNRNIHKAEDPLVVGSSELSLKFIIEALSEEFGDRMSEAKWLVVDPHQLADLLGSSDFIDASKFGGAESRRNGEVGMIYGLKVMVSDRIKTSTIDFITAHSALIYKDEALTLVTKQDIRVEQDRDIEERRSKWVATMWYAIKSYHKQQAADFLNTIELQTA